LSGLSEDAPMSLIGASGKANSTKAPMKMILWGYSGFCSNLGAVSDAQKEDDCPFRKAPQGDA